MFPHDTAIALPWHLQGKSVLGQTIPADFILPDSSNVGGMEAVTDLEVGVPAVPVQWQVKPLPILSVVSAVQLGLLPEEATVALYYKQVL